MSDKLDRVCRDAKDEAFKSIEQYPAPNYTITKIAEESGEVIKAAVHTIEGRDDWMHLRSEIVQSIAMHLRLVQEGDQVHGLPPMPDYSNEAIASAKTNSAPRMRDTKIGYDDMHGVGPVVIGAAAMTIAGLCIIIAFYCKSLWLP